MTLLFVAHGSPAPAYRQQAEAFLAAWQQQYPHRQASLSYIEMAPFFVDVLQTLPAPLLVMPLFLHEGKHYREDVLAVAEASGRPVQMLPALNDVPTMSRLLQASFAEVVAGDMLAGEALAQDAQIVLFSHGAGGAKALSGCQALLADLQQGIGKPCHLALAITEPSLLHTLTLLAERGARQIVIVPHFIFGGQWQAKAQTSIAAVGERFSERFSERFGCKVRLCLPLYHHPLLLSVVAQHINASEPEIKNR